MLKYRTVPPQNSWFFERFGTPHETSSWSRGKSFIFEMIFTAWCLGPLSKPLSLPQLQTRMSHQIVAHDLNHFCWPSCKPETDISQLCFKCHRSRLRANFVRNCVTCSSGRFWSTNSPPQKVALRQDRTLQNWKLVDQYPTNSFLLTCAMFLGAGFPPIHQ